MFNILDLIEYHESENDEEIIETQWKILAPTSKKKKSWIVMWEKLQDTCNIQSTW